MVMLNLSLKQDRKSVVSLWICVNTKHHPLLDSVDEAGWVVHLAKWYSIYEMTVIHLQADAPSYVCWFMLTPLPISISTVNPIVDLEVFLSIWQSSIDYIDYRSLFVVA